MKTKSFLIKFASLKHLRVVLSFSCVKFVEKRLLYVLIKTMPHFHLQTVFSLFDYQISFCFMKKRNSCQVYKKRVKFQISKALKCFLENTHSIQCSLHKPISTEYNKIKGIYSGLEYENSVLETAISPH